jgi:tetratricopeptide (TPR) repeat protein
VTVAGSDAVADLEEERDFLLRSLDDLERERAAGDVTDDDYRTLRDDYTARAAAVLRAIEAGRSEPPIEPTEPDEPSATGAGPSRPQGRPRRRLAAVVAAVALVAAGSGVLVARSSGERTPGQTITGTASVDDDRDLLLRAQAAIGSDPVAALRLYDEVLAGDPDNVEALTYRGWLLYQGTVTGEGLASIERALEIDPSFQDALTFRGLIRRQQGDLEGALADFEAVLDQDPPADIAQLVATAYQETRAAIEGTPTTAAPGTTAP